MSTNPYTRYREVATLSADPGHLVVMLYDGAIRACRQAQALIAEDQPLPANAALIQAQRILRELKQTLDLRQGELAVRLDRLYEYMLGRLVEANVHKESAPVAEVQALLEELRGAWAQVTRPQVPGQEGR